MTDTERTHSPRADEGWAEYLARNFHTEYERLAPTFDYRTRPDSAVPWENVPPQNKQLMISTVVILVANGVIDLGSDWDAENAPGRVLPTTTKEGSDE